MGNILAYCEHADGALRSSALANLTFARAAAAAHGGEVVIALLGDGAAAAGPAAARYAGKVVTVEHPDLSEVLAETYAPVLARLAGEQGATIVTATATAVGKDVIPRTAALLDVAMASDISGLAGANQFTRPILAGNAYATVELSTEVMCVTVRQSEFTAAEELGATGSVEAADAGAVDKLGARIDRVETQKSDRPELTSAKVVVSGGRGMQKGENFKVLEELADLLGAAMGASRAATDAGMVPADWQVGQTGKIVAPNLYIAVAISGAIQHLAGMKGSKTIVAINKDKEAPIAQVADYFLVADLFEAVPALTNAVKAVKAGG